MGVDVVLVQVIQAGTSPKKRRLGQVDVVLDRSDTFAHLCEASGLPMLSRVDPYGTLILTSAEMDQFINEIETIQQRFGTSPEKTLLIQVAQLAARCQDHPSLELHLEGD